MKIYTLISPDIQILKHDISCCFNLKTISTTTYYYNLTLSCYRGEPRNVDLDRPNCVIAGNPDPFVVSLIKAANTLEEALSQEEYKQVSKLKVLTVSWI